MSSKLVRINDPAQIKARIRDFMRKKINLVLKDNTVVFGELRKTTEDEIVIINMRLKHSKLRLSDIAELQADTRA